LSPTKRKKPPASPTTPVNWSELSTGEILARYPERFLACRVQHTWNPEPIWDLLTPTVKERQQICTRCASVRKQPLDSQFRPIQAATIDYAPGYLTPKTGLTRGDFQATHWERDFLKALDAGRVHAQGSLE